jgi:PAT family beta-lactamase induction signal transducer AmpG
VERLLRMRSELKGMFTDRDSLIGLLIFLSPVPSQAASNLFTSIAPDYSTGEHAVALITGIGGGLLSALGCAIAGFVCDRVDRRYAYVLGGVYLGACSMALLVARPGPGSYIVLTSFYMIGAGYAIAASFALAFQIVGHGGGLTGGTRLGLYAGAVALAILYCTMAEGWTYDHAGRRGMFALDAGFNLVGALAMTCFLWRFGAAAIRSEAVPA